MGFCASRVCVRMCVHEEGFLPSSALSNSNPIKALLLWGLAVLPAARPAAHLKPSSTQRLPLAHRSIHTWNKCAYALKCTRTHTHKYIHTHTIPPFSKVVCVASELTSHHHPGCWQPLLWPPGAWPPSELCLDNQSVRRQAILAPAGLDATTHTHRLHIPGLFGY